MYKFNYKVKFNEMIETENLINLMPVLSSSFVDGKYFKTLSDKFTKYNNYFVEPRKEKKIIDMSDFKKGTTRFFK